MLNMRETPGETIIMKLRKLRRNGLPGTQRWLMEEINKRRENPINESMLSTFLNERYGGGCSEEIIKLASEIVDQALQRIA